MAEETKAWPRKPFIEAEMRGWTPYQAYHETIGWLVELDEHVQGLEDQIATLTDRVNVMLGILEETDLVERIVQVIDKPKKAKPARKGGW